MEAYLFGNIQGCLANALITIFNSKSIGLAIKWVDDFIISIPFHTSIDISSASGYSYPISIYGDGAYQSLGILLDPINVKGQDFKSMVPYVGFIWTWNSTLSPCPKETS